MEIPKSADYVIVGGGTAGLVLAERLSENPSVHVVVLEAGTDMTQDPRVQIPALWTSLMGTDVDWQLKTTPQVSEQDCSWTTSTLIQISLIWETASLENHRVECLAVPLP